MSTDDLIPAEFVRVKVQQERPAAAASSTKYARYLLSTYPRLQHLTEGSVARYVRQALTTLPGEVDVDATKYAAHQAKEAERWKRAYLAQEEDPLKATREALQKTFRELRCPQRTPQADRTQTQAGPRTDTGRCLVAVPTDVHLGQEDIDRTLRELHQTTAILYRRAERMGGVEEVVIPVGSDFLHVDTDSNTTTKGTPQAVGCYEPAEVIRIGFRAIMETVDTYRDLVGAGGVVTLIGMHGNHDLLTGKAMLAALEIIYAGDPNVQVLCTFDEHTYHRPRCGNHLLGFHHGHGQKATDLPSRMSVDRPRDWGACEFKSWYTGHLHHRVQYDDGGCFIHQCPALSRPSKWSKRHGYVGSRRGQVGFLLCPNDGLIAELCAYV